MVTYKFDNKSVAGIEMSMFVKNLCYLGDECVILAVFDEIVSTIEKIAKNATW